MLRNLQGLSLDAIRHLVYLMIDDLHVHRLRQIWMLIGQELGVEYECLKDTRLRQVGGGLQRAA